MIVKICGLTRVEDALAAVDAGADLIGLVFAESPRRITLSRAREISRAVGSGALKVGVFVDEDPGVVAETIEGAGLDLVQLHGSETPGYCRDIHAGIIKAIRVRDGESLLAAAAFTGSAEYLLLDSHVPGVAGGTGKIFDWSLTGEFGDLPRPWILAGGLTPENVAGAVKAALPDGVDVSGGVEKEPGIKDGRLITDFIDRVKGGQRV